MRVTAAVTDNIFEDETHHYDAGAILTLFCSGPVLDSSHFMLLNSDFRQTFASVAGLTLLKKCKYFHCICLAEFEDVNTHYIYYFLDNTEKKLSRQ